MAQYLRRYTNLPSLLFILREKKITLLDPQTWDDKNDSHYLTIYKQKKSLQCVLALCFSQARETYHHWKVFADGSSGVCIRFHRIELETALKKRTGVTLKSVSYVSLNKMKKRKLKTVELPFLKRSPYGDEREFRAIFESKTDKLKALTIDIPLASIERVTLSPWMPYALSMHVKKTLNSLNGCSGLKVVRSTLISNERWKNYSESAT